MMCRFENGASGIVDFSRVATGRKFRQAYEIYGTKGSLVYDYDEMNRLRFYTNADPVGRRGFRAIDVGPEHPTYRAFLPLPNFSLGYNETKIIEAAEVIRSITTGRPCGRPSTRAITSARSLMPAWKAPACGRGSTSTSCDERGPRCRLKCRRAILDALTDVEMPRLPPDRGADETLAAGGLTLPLYRADCLVVGIGRGGLRAAVELARRGVGVAVASQSAWGGTSACSGSDKQTIHTANTADRGDDFRAMAAAIARGRGDGRRHRLCRGRRLGPRDGVAPVSRPAAAAGPARRDAALPDRSRRGRARDQLRSAHLAPDGQGAGGGGAALGIPISTTRRSCGC